MAFNIPAIAAGLVALAPAAVVLFVAFGRYDGHFRDNVVFLWFIGGLFGGMLLALFSIYVLTLGLELHALGVSLAAALAMAAALNRRKWVGEAHSVFNGGALGVGLSVMVLLALAQRYLLPKNDASAWALAGLFALGVGLTFTNFAAGAWVGRGIAERQPFRHAAVAAGALVVPYFILAFYARAGSAFGFASTTTLAAALVAGVYGLVALGVGRERVLPLGLSAEASRAMRREARRGAE